MIAAIRDPNSSSSQGLYSLPTGDQSQLILVKLDSLSETDAKNAVDTLRSKHDISKLDIVMANAGIGKDFSTVVDTTPQEMRDHFEVNVLGPLILFHAVLPLLNAASNPKFMATSSSVGSIGDAFQYPSLAYGASKAALNYLVMKIHVEHTNITAVALHPGYIPTPHVLRRSMLMSMLQMGTNRSRKLLGESLGWNRGAFDFEAKH